MEYLFLTLCLMALGFIALGLILRRMIFRMFSRAAQLEEVKREVEKMLVELNHTAGRNIDLVEERMGQLREMIASVDKRLGVYRRELEKTEVNQAVYQALGKRPAQAAEKPPQEVFPSISLRDKILNLYHAGFTSAMIANQLKSSIGEVELVISLAEKD